MTQVNIKELKEKVSIVQVAAWLELPLTAKADHFFGPCPFCKASAFKVTPEYRNFRCFKCNEKGSMIDLVSKLKKLSVREAAVEIHNHFNGKSEKKDERKFDIEKYASALQQDHESLESLQISPETLTEWKAGYCSTGINRGKLAVPLTLSGNIVGYAGRSVDCNELTFPKEMHPEFYIFGEHMVREGRLHLMRDVVDVLKGYEDGMNPVAFLTETITLQQLKLLVTMMEKKGCTDIEIY